MVKEGVGGKDWACSHTQASRAIRSEKIRRLQVAAAAFSGSAGHAEMPTRGTPLAGRIPPAVVVEALALEVVGDRAVSPG